MVSGPGTALNHGVWSQGLAANPGFLLLEGTDLVIQSESDGILTGAEGVILLAPTPIELRPFEVSWSNPAIGGNEYLIRQAPSGLDAWYEGGAGENAAVTVTITEMQQVEAAFRPSSHGWHFSNTTWPAVPNAAIDLSLFKIPISNASQGMCGGMAYSAIDYYLANRQIPGITASPAGLFDPYFAFVSARLYDRFHLPSGPLKHIYSLYQRRLPPQSRPYVTIKDAIPDGDVAAELVADRVVGHGVAERGDRCPVEFVEQ